MRYILDDVHNGIFHGLLVYVLRRAPHVESTRSAYKYSQKHVPEVNVDINARLITRLLLGTWKSTICSHQ